MIPTAEEFLNNIEIWDGVFVHSSNAQQAMIEFAKLCVEDALKEAYHNAEIYKSRQEEKYDYVDESNFSVRKDSILKAYPLTNIK